MINFANYNYLGLSGDPDVTRAAQDAVARWGSSVSASRVVSGERPVHRALEQEIARFLGVDDALVYIGGHPANVSTISHLFGPRRRDPLRRADAQQRDAGRRVLRRAPAHLPAQRLARARRDAASACARSIAARSIVIEGVYSADGDIPDLARFVEVKERHAAMLMVDEAHSLGVLGATGRGIAEHAGVDPRGASTSGWAR